MRTDTRPNQAHKRNNITLRNVMLLLLSAGHFLYFDKTGNKVAADFKTCWLQIYPRGLLTSRGDTGARRDSVTVCP